MQTETEPLTNKTKAMLAMKNNSSLFADIYATTTAARPLPRSEQLTDQEADAGDGYKGKYKKLLKRL